MSTDPKLTAEELDEIERANIGCYMCQEGRPHIHAPNWTPYPLSAPVSRLCAALREAWRERAEHLEIVHWARAQYDAMECDGDFENCDHCAAVDLFEPLHKNQAGPSPDPP